MGFTPLDRPRMHPCILMASFVAFASRNATVGSAL
jgi:hypothetical protein